MESALEVEQISVEAARDLIMMAASKDYDFESVYDSAKQDGLDLTTIKNVEDGNTALHVAAGFGRLSWVQALVDRGADVNIQNNDGQGPLHAACHHAHKNAAQILLLAGANVDILDKKKRSPLYLVISRSDNSCRIKQDFWEVVELLLIFGANPYAKSISDKNCFSLISDKEQRLQVRIIHLLKKLNDLDTHDDESRRSTIDKYLRVKDFFELIIIGDENLDIIEKLLTPRLINSRLETKDDISPLHRAAGYNHLETARLLIEAGADVNATDRHGRIPLHNAAEFSHIEMIDLLITKGSDINRQDNEGFAPIHVAASNTTYETCERLRKLGANISLKTKSGEMAFDLAESEDVRAVLRSCKITLKEDSLSIYAQPIYIDNQVADDDDCQPLDEFMHDDLMLDSRSVEKLFDSKPNTKIVRLDKNDPIYRQIDKRMTGTIVSHTNSDPIYGYKIVKIEKILNKQLWNDYRWECKKLEGKFGRRNEKLLFHGSKYIETIKLSGFDERYAKDDGMFGSGIYFAAHSSKANQYTFGFDTGCAEHKDKSCDICVREMIYAQVALGRSLQAKQAMNNRYAPPGHSSVSGLPSNLKDLQYPEYVIYRGEHAYPLYVISYRIICSQS